MNSSFVSNSLYLQLEEVRQELYQNVQGELSRLADPSVLPISEQLDLLIVKAQKELLKK